MKYTWLLIPALALAIGCGPQKSVPPGNNGNDTVKPAPPGDSAAFDIQGHRGFRGLYPENSVEGFIAALDAGATTLEMDIAISADSQLVVSHEPWMSPGLCTTPDGMTIRPKDTLRYAIFKWNYEDLSQFDCGSLPNPGFPLQKKMKTHKPTLAEVVAAVNKWEQEHHRKANYNIETKTKPEWDRKFTPPPAVFVRLLLAEIKKLGISGRTTIQSFDVRTLQEARRQWPGMPLALLVSNTESEDENIRGLGFNPDIYSPNHDLLSAEMIGLLHAQHIRVIPWTINTRAEMQYAIDLGADGIITDYPDSLYSLVKQR